MTLTNFKNQEHIFVFDNGIIIHIGEHVCLGFTHGAYISMWSRDYINVKPDDPSPSGFVYWSKEYAHTLSAIFAKDYKRFPIKRFALWLRNAIATDHKKVRHLFQETCGYRTKQNFLERFPNAIIHRIEENK